MEKDKDKLYDLKERAYLKQNEKKSESYSAKSFTAIPDPVEEEYDATSLLEDNINDKDK